MSFRPLLLALFALGLTVSSLPGRPAAQTGQGVQTGQGAQTGQGVQTGQAQQSAQNEAALQVSAVMYHRLMAEVIRTGIRDQIGSAASEVNPYPGVTAGKALAVCVNWQKSTLDRVTWGGFAYRYGATVKPEERSALQSRTLADCRAAYAGRDCECQLLDVDGQNVLDVPARFLAEYGRF